MPKIIYHKLRYRSPPLLLRRAKVTSAYIDCYILNTDLVISYKDRYYENDLPYTFRAGSTYIL
jgi:hypothetical protein